MTVSSVAWETRLRGVIALLFGFGLMQMGNTFQGTLLSIRGSMSGFSPIEIGAVGAAFWAGIVIGSLRGGTVIRRVGHIRTFAALGAVASTAPLMHLLVVNPLAWIAARALTGFCFAGMFIVVESWLNGTATAETRGRVLSIYSMTGLIAGIAGQLLFPSTDPAGFKGRAIELNQLSAWICAQECRRLGMNIFWWRRAYTPYGRCAIKLLERFASSVEL
jgi:MFS family permease